MRWATLLAAVLTAGPAAAEPAPDDPPEVGRTVVTGLRLPRPLRDVPGTVTVIARDEIERSPHAAADDVVRIAPSVMTFRRSPSLVADPTSQGVNLRGLGPSGVSRALVLRDGVPLNDAFGGWVYWRAVPLIDVDRIEIAPGGASASFGNHAIGGAIQLFSRPIRGRALEAALATGTLATRRAALRATERVGGLGLALDADLLDSAGYAPIAPDARGPVDGAAASRHLVVGARAELRRAGGLGRAHARLFHEALDAGTEHQTAAVLAASYGLGWTQVGPRGTFELALFGGDQALDQDRARVGDGRATARLASRQHAPSHGQGALVTWTAPTLARAGAHTVLVGADLRRVDGESRDTIFPPGEAPFTRTAGGAQDTAGVFVEDAARLGDRVQVAAAVRADLWRNHDGARVVTRDGDPDRMRYADRRAVEVNPRVGVLVHASDALAVRASAARGFRAPTLNELYRPFQVGTVMTEANPALDAETAWSAEAGGELVSGGLVARATGFWTRLDDPIQNVTLATPLPSGATRQRQNLGRARVRGVELEASWRPSPRWIATAGYTLADAVVTAAPDHEDLIGKRLAQAPRHRATGSVGFDDPALATVTAQVRWLGRQYEDDLNTLPMAGFVVLDAMAARALGAGLTGVVTVENATDRRYLVGRAGVDTIGPPRTVLVGLRFAAGK